MTRGVIQPERSPQVTDLLIRQKAEVMILWAYTALRQFPKWERHVLAAEMRRTLWNLLRLIVVCNKKYFKKTTLQELDAEIDLLRSQVRLAKDLGYLDFRRYIAVPRRSQKTHACVEHPSQRHIPFMI